VRAFELAKAFGMRSNQLLAKVKELKLPVRNSFATVSDEDIARLAKSFGKPVPTEVPTSIGTVKPKAPPKPKGEKKKKVAPKKAAKKPAAKKAGTTKSAKAKSAKSAEETAERPAVEAPPGPEIGAVVRAAPADEAPGEPAEAPAVPDEPDILDGVALGGVVRAAPEVPEPKLPDRRAKKTRKASKKKPPARRSHMEEVAIDVPHAGFQAPVTEGELPEGVVIEKDEETKIHIVRPRRSSPTLSPSSPEGPASGLDPDRFRISPQVEALLRSYQPARRRRRPRPHYRGRRQMRRPIPVVRPTEVDLVPPLTIRSISQALKVKSRDILSKLIQQEIRLTVDDTVDEDVAQMLGMEFGVEVRIRKGTDLEQQLVARAEYEEEEPGLEPRPPVVTVLGHVDHGKTSLLDAIRETNVAEGEAGGITQHIGASVVEHDGHQITFIDTPGHEAFTAMRARGADVTDIAVLVVAADDGVMPQTEEAINHAKAAGVAIVVAINKCDLPGANTARVKQQLAGLELIPEEWSGSIGTVECSAVTKQGIDVLLERTILEAEILELKANPTKPARGTVLESSVSEGRGNVATVLVQDGTLRKGDVILSSGAFGRVKQLMDHQGREVLEAPPSMPVAVLGLSEVPEAGDDFYVLESLAEAREIAEQRRDRARAETLIPRRRVTLESLSEVLAASGTKELPLLLKADAMGTLEALKENLTDLSTDEVRVKILHAGVGAIIESDVLLADASGAIILGFNVVTEGKASRLAEEKGVQTRVYRVIYELTDEVRKGLEGLLDPAEEIVVTGHVAVRQVFKITRVGTVVGGYVTDGVISRTNRVRLARDGVVIHEGRVGSLRRFKDDQRECREGFECGVKIDGYDDVKVGDIIEALEVRQVARSLSSSPSSSSSSGR